MTDDEKRIVEWLERQAATAYMGKVSSPEERATNALAAVEWFAAAHAIRVGDHRVPPSSGSPPRTRFA